MSLEILGTIIGTIRKYEVHSDKSNDGKTANVDIDIVMSEEEALAFGGEIFAKACFSDYVEDTNSATVKSKTLGGELVIKQEHTLSVNGHPLVTKPKITGLELSEKERSATITLRLPVPGSQKQVRRMLDEACGDAVTVEIKGVTQLVTPGSEDDPRHGFDGANGGEPATA